MRTHIGWSSVASAALLSLAWACSSSSNNGGLTGNGDQGDGGSNGGSSSSSSSGGTTGSSGNGSSGTFSTSGAGGTGNGTCKTGEYVGTFSCSFYEVFDAGIYFDGGGMTPLAGPLMGTMTFALTQDQTAGVGEGSGTDIAMGNFVASLAGIIQANADLQGTLNCGAGTFTGNLVNGVYGLGSGNPDATPVSGGGTSNTFMGPLVSDYDGTTAAFVGGHWEMTIPTLGECVGTWTATYSGGTDSGTD
jgi:hypothetical protein